MDIHCMLTHIMGCIDAKSGEKATEGSTKGVYNYGSGTYMENVLKVDFVAVFVAL